MACDLTSKTTFLSMPRLLPTHHLFWTYLCSMWPSFPETNTIKIKGMQSHKHNLGGFPKGLLIMWDWRLYAFIFQARQVEIGRESEGISTERGVQTLGCPSWLSTDSCGLWRKKKKPSHLGASISSCRKGTVRSMALLALTFYKRGHVAVERTVGLGKSWVCLHERLRKTHLIYSGRKQISGCRTGVKR